ncbi:MAG: hypothetical protein MUO21_03520 [Nitrososphaeraceae archaeon]|nr:hypothetical protein [Nitrososphaeraceae archaeon]
MRWIIFATLIIIIVLILTQNKSNNEHFSENINPLLSNVPTTYGDPKWQGKLSSDCYTEKPENCLNFSNCGICMNNGTCIPGDQDGPFFQGGCNGWLYSNYADRKIFNEKVTSIVPPWDTFYPDYEATFPSPVSWAAL